MTASALGRKTSLARTGLAVLALVMLVCENGCSHFRSRRKDTSKGVAELGTELPGRDIYAKAPVLQEEPTDLAAAEDRNDMRPDSRGDLPAESGEANLSEPVVKLQPPVLVDPAKIGAMSTNTGVPDGARLIAASRPSARLAESPEPVAIKPTTQVTSAAREALDAMTSYQLALRRQERVNGVLLPAEDLVMSIRRSPKAARLTWMDGPHQGREVLYRSDEPGGLMHVNMADSKLPLPRLSIAPDSPMVMKNSRHPITEAGLEPLVASMEQAETAGTLIDLGMQTPAPLDHPHHGVMRRTEQGDVWRAYFDPEHHLPALVECRSSSGELIEYYLFRNIEPNPPELAAAAAFDPDARWGAPRGLFNRPAARSAQQPDATTTTTR